MADSDENGNRMCEDIGNVFGAVHVTGHGYGASCLGYDAGMGNGYSLGNVYVHNNSHDGGHSSFNANGYDGGYGHGDDNDGP